MKSRITIIVMTGADCNLRCRYCYVFASRRNAQKFNPGDIATLIHNCSVGFDGVEFCWHGGEPLLVGMEFYQAVIEAQRVEQRTRTIEYRNLLQSNGTLLNESWFRFLKENGIRAGISFDAPPDVHAFHRGVAPEETIALWERLKRFGLPINVLCVVSKLNAGRGKEIFEFFVAHGVNSYSFLPLRMVPLASRPPQPTDEEVFDLYRTTFDLWAHTPNTIRSIEPLETMVRALLGERPLLCSFAASCPERMITIDQEGNVIPCSSLVAEKFIVGNVLQEPLVQVLAKPAVQKLSLLRAESLRQHCHGCEFVALCNGGCRADAYWHSGRYDGQYPYCRARKMTFEHLRNRLETILPSVAYTG